MSQGADAHHALQQRGRTSPARHRARQKGLARGRPRPHRRYPKITTHRPAAVELGEIPASGQGGVAAAFAGAIPEGAAGPRHPHGRPRPGAGKDRARLQHALLRLGADPSPTSRDWRRRATAQASPPESLRKTKTLRAEDLSPPSPTPKARSWRCPSSLGGTVLTIRHKDPLAIARNRPLFFRRSS
jgi:hypothetical protein